MTLLAPPNEKTSRKAVAVANFCEVISVWSPGGATGKSLIALNLAFELTQLGKSVLLIDADTHSPALTTYLGISEPNPGIAATARLIRQGRFNLEQLQRLTLNIKRKRLQFRVLPGLTSVNRWPELSSETIIQLFAIAKPHFDYVLIDLATPLEDNLTNPETPITRNAITRAALSASDQTLVILRESELSLQRYLHNFSLLSELQKSRKLVLNFSTRASKYVAALRQLTKESIFAHVPEDFASIQIAESTHLPLALARRKSPARNAIADLANRLLVCQPLAN